jgi:hypothetical protein
VLYDLRDRGEKVLLSAIRNAATELLRMVIRPVEACLKLFELIRGCLNVHRRFCDCQIRLEGGRVDVWEDI